MRLIVGLGRPVSRARSRLPSAVTPWRKQRSTSSPRASAVMKSGELAPSPPPAVRLRRAGRLSSTLPSGLAAGWTMRLASEKDCISIRFVFIVYFE
ncbi:hypothetical protein D9M68_846320 [compost metagenome]